MEFYFWQQCGSHILSFVFRLSSLYIHIRDIYLVWFLLNSGNLNVPKSSYLWFSLMNSSINSSFSSWNQNQTINYINLLQWQGQEQKIKYLRWKIQVYRSKSFQKKYDWDFQHIDNNRMPEIISEICGA